MQYLKPILLLLAVILSVNTAASQSINWMEMKKAQAKASETGKKVMIYAEAKWCGYCKKMEQQVFPRKSVQDSLHKYFYPVRLDIESTRKITFGGRTLSQRMLARKFRVRSTPTMIFLNASGEVMGTQPGFMRAEIFDKLLSFVGSEIYREQKFKAYLNEHGVELN